MSHSDYAEAMRATAKLTTADEAMVARVQARLDSGVAPSPWRRVVPIAAVLLAGLGAGVAWWSTQAPTVERVGERLTVDGVSVARIDGEGAHALVDGTLRVDWIVGRLELLAEPSLPVEVVTREGSTLAPQGGVVVVRDAMGSHVEAVAAEAEVACGDAPERVVAVGEVHTCLPTTASGWLGRAHALAERGAHDDALASVDAGLALVPDGTVAVELMTAGMEVALATHDLDAAVAFAEEALAVGPSARGEELHRVAARGWLIGGDCARALPHLDALSSLDASEAQHQARCRAE